MEQSTDGPLEYGLSGKTIAEMRRLYAEKCKPGEVAVYEVQWADFGYTQWYVVPLPDLKSAFKYAETVKDMRSIYAVDWIFDGATAYDMVADDDEATPRTSGQGEATR